MKTKEMREEDARNSLVYFTDVRDGKNTRGFGIDLGSDMPQGSRRILYRFEVDAPPFFLDESNPLITLRWISYEKLLVCAQYLFHLSDGHVDPVMDDTGWRGDIIEDMRSNPVFSTIDAVNRFIVLLKTLVPAKALYAYEENLSDAVK